ncbi:MAG: FG-GAP repeat domain-containing protein, partial [Planctomycetota bacterium]
SPADLLSMRPDVNVSLGWNRPTDDARSTFWYAEPKVGDWNGDGKSDVVIYQRRQIVVFLQRAGGRFGPAPTLTMPLEFTGALEEGRFKLDLELPTEVDDIDGDGTVEIIASHVGRATTQVYRGGPERKDLGRPDALIKLEGITFVQFVTDLDGDGRSDLILARTDKPGLLGILTVLITKEVEVELLFFFGRGGGEVLPRVPDERRTIEIPILFSSARRGLNVGTSAVLSVLGDFDGDGQNDLILRTGEDKIGLFPGQGRKFAEDELVTLTVQPMDGYRFLEPTPVSLNGDKVADLVLTYYSWDGKGDRMSLLVSSEE